MKCKAGELTQRLSESIVHHELDALVSWTDPEADRPVPYRLLDPGPFEHEADMRLDYQQGDDE